MSQHSPFDASPFRLPPLDAFGYLVEARLATHRRSSLWEAPDLPVDTPPRVDVLGPMPGRWSRLVNFLRLIPVAQGHTPASERP